jgi:hypothetical protein
MGQETLGETPQLRRDLAHRKIRTAQPDEWTISRGYTAKKRFSLYFQ